MIPELEEGVLPEGVYSCTVDEVEQKFGRFSHSDRRPRLTELLRSYIKAADRAGVAVAVLIDGSYVTSKAEPNDIDLMLVLRSDFELTTELSPMEYNVQSKRMVRKLYGFDVLTAVEGSGAYDEYLGLFSQVRLDDPEQSKTRRRKGLLRIDL